MIPSLQSGVAGSRRRGGEFAPTSISDCLVWLDASDEDTITDTLGAVDQIDDKSGNSNHATSSSTARPTTGTRTQNSLNVLDFDGSDDVLTVSSLTVGGYMTVFAVVTQDVDNTACVVEHSANTNANDGFYVFNLEGTTVGIRRSGSLQSWNINSGWLPSYTGTFLQIMALYDGDWLPHRDGAEPSNNVNGGSDRPDTDVTDDFYIGNRTAFSQAFDGEIAEVILYDRNLGQSEYEQVQGYLAHKWGIESRLPSGHPYKSSPP